MVPILSEDDVEKGTISGRQRKRQTDTRLGRQGKEQRQRKQRRGEKVRKACDACSIRKVKCNDCTLPCAACAAAGIPCTFERVLYRRGPPNRYAENIRRQYFEEATAESVSVTSTTITPIRHTEEQPGLTTSTIACNQQPIAHSICSVETLDLLIDEFFVCIYPLYPFPHEPSFRNAWKRRKDLSDKKFLALLASMVGVLVATFPGKFATHLNNDTMGYYNPDLTGFIDKCQNICLSARGPDYIRNSHLGVNDAATSYFLATIEVHTRRWRQSQLYFGECFTIIRSLGVHKTSGQTSGDKTLQSLSTSVTSKSRSDCGNAELDNIARQMGLRIFWTLFVCMRSNEQLGTAYIDIQMPPPTASNPFPSLPEEVDDLYIFATHNGPQPTETLSTMTMFNINVKLYSSYNPIATMEMAWGVDTVVQWHRQEIVLVESLKRCENVISRFPLELDAHNKRNNIRIAGLPKHSLFRMESPRARAQHLLALLLRWRGTLRKPTTQDKTVENRRLAQDEIHEANIYISSLAIRAYIVRKYWTLMEARASFKSSRRTTVAPSLPTISTSAFRSNCTTMQDPESDCVAIGEFSKEYDKILDELSVVSQLVDRSEVPFCDDLTVKMHRISRQLLEIPVRFS